MLRRSSRTAGARGGRPRRRAGLLASALITTVALGCGVAGEAALDSTADTGPRENSSAGDSEITDLPGAEPFPPGLKRTLAEALAAKGRDYKPRTHHLRPDGGPRYTNRLILETSPYLLQHAHNPVNWYPWGDEAFETARRLGRPVFLSIGYSTCHWCHVMERESFEDEEIARYLNEHYVAIKVDREERPDIDSIYMTAVQAMTGHGGWPMSVWLTPDRKPFFGGTYFPPRDGVRGARVGFLTILQRIREQYDLEPDKVQSFGQRLESHIRQNLQASRAGEVPGVEVLERAAAYFRSQFDPVHGGANRAPKFPSSFPVRLMLRWHRRSGDAAFQHMAEKTLEAMARGGIHDQIGGGFHRYATDQAWLVPHFEKMLYDNALLAVAYLEGAQATGREDFLDVAASVLDYVRREMTSPEGGFYSATDADSPTPGGGHEEGYFFTWTPAEIRAALPETEARLVIAFYGVTEKGNFEGRNILHQARPLEDVAAELELDPGKARRLLDSARRRLYEVRSHREPPLRDDKILTSWNGLMISAFARGAFVLGRAEDLASARRAAEFVLEHLRRDGRLRRSYQAGKARHAAYLDDYAFLIQGLLDLYETDADVRWLREALALQAVLDEHYADDEGGGYFLTADDHEALLAREKPAYDGAEPSGNAVEAMNLLRFHELTSDDRWRQRAEGLLKAFGRQLSEAPATMSEMLLAVDFRLDRPKEIVIVVPSARSDAEPFFEVLRRTFLPNRVLVVAEAGKHLERHAAVVPLLEGKKALDGHATAYVCEQGICELPARDPETFQRQLAPPAEAPSGS